MEQAPRTTLIPGPNFRVHFTWNNQQHVNYLGPSAVGTTSATVVHELWYSDGNGWRHNELNQLAGAESFPGANTSRLDGYVTPWNNQQHVNYQDAFGHIHELWYADSSGWRHNDLTSLAGALDFTAAMGSHIDGYVTPWNNQQHVNYLDAQGHVHELWYSDNGGWKHNDLTALAGAQEFTAGPGSDLKGYATPWNNQQHVVYLDAAGHVHELLYAGDGPWQHSDLTALARALEFAAGAGSSLDAYVT